MESKFIGTGNGDRERGGICRVKEEEYNLLKQIVAQFVYKSCDYLICLDGARGTYTTFLRKEGLMSTPPAESEDYQAEIKKCVEAYVEPEDREYVLRETDLYRVLKALDQKGVHTFTYGVRLPEGGYERKCLKYVYYDHSRKLVLFLRTDITEEYMEQRRQNERLLTALENARTDSLTGSATARRLGGR